MGAPTHSEEKQKKNEELKHGLYNKYLIRKTNNCAVDTRAEYFVLRLDEFAKDKRHADASRKAILTYAEEIKDHLPELASDIFKKYK